MQLRVISDASIQMTDARKEIQNNEDDFLLASDDCHLASDFDDLWIDIGGEG
jgi:hypothetical protein